MKSRSDVRANKPGFSTGDHIPLYKPARKKGPAQSCSKTGMHFM